MQVKNGKVKQIKKRVGWLFGQRCTMYSYIHALPLKIIPPQIFGQRVSCHT